MNHDLALGILENFYLVNRRIEERTGINDGIMEIVLDFDVFNSILPHVENKVDQVIETEKDWGYSSPRFLYHGMMFVRGKI